MQRYIISAFLGMCVATLIMFVYSYNIPESVAATALQKKGFTDIQITRRLPFIVALFKGCGIDDLMGFNANAVNARGEPVKDIIVCTGTLKGTSIMF